VGVVGSFGMRLLAMDWLRLDVPQIQTYLFLKMAVACGAGTVCRLGTELFSPGDLTELMARASVRMLGYEVPKVVLSHMY